MINKSRKQRIKEAKERSRKKVKILSFAKRRLYSNGINYVLIDKIYKSVYLLKGDLVEKLYLENFGASASQDFYSGDKSFSQYRKKVKTVKKEKSFAAWTDQYQAHLKSPKWKKFRSSILKSYDNICQKCKNKFNAKILHVHHLHYNTLGDEKPEDVLLVCKPCHEEIHGRKF